MTATPDRAALRLRWRGVIALEGVTTTDGRRITPGALTWTLPRSLLKDGLVPFPVGTVDTITREENGRIVATGTIDRGALSAVENGLAVTLSEMEVQTPRDDVLTITAGEILGVYLSDLPAWTECRLEVIA